MCWCALRARRPQRGGDWRAVVVVVDESFDLRLEVARQVVVFQCDAVLQGLVPALDLALCLGVAGRAANMVHGLLAQPLRQLAGDVAGPVVGQRRGRCRTRGWAQPEAVSAISSVSVTSLAAMLVHSFQAIMERKKSSRTVER